MARGAVIPQVCGGHRRPSLPWLCGTKPLTEQSMKG